MESNDVMNELAEAMKNHVQPVDVSPVVPPVTDVIPPVITPPVIDPATPPVVDPVIPPVDIVPPVDPTLAPPAPNLLDAFTAVATPPAIPDTPVVPTVPAITPDIQAQLDRLKQIDEQAEKNPFMAALKYGVTPEKIAEIARDILPEDLSGMPYQTLLKIDIERDLGLTGEALEKAFEESMAEHEGLGVVGKARAEKALKEKFKPTGTKESAFLKGYKEQFDASMQSQPQPPSKETLDAITQGDLSAIDEAAKAYEGQEVYGVKFDTSKVKAAYNPNTIHPYIDAQGNANMKQFVVDQFMIQNGATLAKAAYEAGRLSVLKETANPDRTAGSTPANIINGKSRAEQMSEHFFGTK